jgi:hypothetical protein
MRLSLIACLALLLPIPVIADAEREISPLLVGTNLWYGDPADSVWQMTRDAQIKLIRIGGHAYDKNLPSDETLVAWVKKIRSYGAEPLIQVSQYQSPEKAAAVVRLFNISGAAGGPVRYWNIGNEPWLQNGRNDPSTVAAQVVTFFKPIAAAMKAVDPSIKIYGFDEAYYMEPAYQSLFGGEHDITGRVSGKEYYYVDGLSWHRYPQTEVEPGLSEINEFRGAMEKIRLLIDRANAKHGRSGDQALQWGLGEFNAKNGRLVHTFGNGQMFGAVYGYAMLHGATYVASWSMFESSGNRGRTDYGAFDGAQFVPRASYWHQRMVGENFSGRVVTAATGRPDVLAFAAYDAPASRLSVMIINVSTDPGAIPFDLRFGPAGGDSRGLGINLGIDAAGAYAGMLEPRSTQTLVFEAARLKTITYTAEDFAEARSPTTIDLPSPVRLPR